MADNDLEKEPYYEDETLPSETTQKLLIKTETCDGVFDESIKDLFSCWDKYSELANLTVGDVLKDDDNVLLSRLTVLSNLPSSKAPKDNDLAVKYIKEMFAICRMKVRRTSCPVTEYLSFEVDLSYTNNNGILRLTHQNYTYDLDIATTLLVTPDKAKQIKKAYFTHIKKDPRSINMTQRGITFLEWLVAKEKRKEEELRDPVLMESANSIKNHFDTYICLVSNAIEVMYSRTADMLVLAKQHQSTQKATQLEEKLVRIAYVSEMQATKLTTLTELVAKKGSESLKQDAYVLLNKSDMTPDGTPFKCVSGDILSLLGTTQETMDLRLTKEHKTNKAKTNQNGSE